MDLLSESKINHITVQWAQKWFEVSGSFNFVVRTINIIVHYDLYESIDNACVITNIYK